MVFFLCFILDIFYLKISQTFCLHSTVRSTFKIFDSAHSHMFIMLYIHIYIKVCIWNKTYPFKVWCTLIFSVLLFHLYKISSWLILLIFLCTNGSWPGIWETFLPGLLSNFIMLLRKIKCYNEIMWISIWHDSRKYMSANERTLSLT